MASASAIILAGGRSRRMGTPKAALKFGNRTILEGLVSELRSGFDDIVVVAAPLESEPFSIGHLLRNAASPMRLLRDRNSYEGAAVALAAGLTAALNDIAFVCSCDLPLLRNEIATALCGMLNGFEAVIPDIGGQPQPLCAVYRCTAAATIEMQLASGERRLTRITNLLKAYRPGELQLRQIDPDLHSFVNVNTPEDYSRALAIRKSRDTGD